MPRKISLDVIIRRINEKCKEKNYEFNGFCDKNGADCEWRGTDYTFLKLKCNTCGNEWNTTNFYNFTKKSSGCPKCKTKLLSSKFMLPTEKVLNDIYHLCKEKNCTFNGFCDKNGADCEWYGVKTHLKFKCNTCGNEWNSTDFNHLKNSNGCIVCSKKLNSEKLRLNIENVIKNILSICSDRNYEFKGFCDKNGNNIENYNGYAKTYLKLKCHICGYEWKTTNYAHFMRKEGCPKCCKTMKLELNHAIERILEKCNVLNVSFNGFCDKNGTDCEWYGTSTYLKLKCNTCGSEWKTTTYDYFVHGFKVCQFCQTSFLEKDIERLLSDNGIDFEKQKRFEWLGKQSLDFFIPPKNIAIECQGEQHFKPIEYFGGTKKFQKMLLLDKKKQNLCTHNGINILYYSNLAMEFPYAVFTSKDALLQKIRET